MMALLNALFIFACLLVMFALGYLLFLGVWATGVLALRPKRKWPWWIASFPVYVVLFVTVLGTLVWAVSRPDQVFEREFGFAPTADVQDLQSSYWVLGDSGHTYLAFKADPSTIQRIVARGLAPVTVSAQPITVYGHSPPAWWQPTTGSNTERYIGDFSGRAFTSEEEYLSYDPIRRQAYYRFSGID